MLKVNDELKQDCDTVFDFVLSKARINQNTEQVNLPNLLGRVLSEPLYSSMNVPNLAMSDVDGYGFSSKSKQNLLPVVDTIYAGRVDLRQGISTRKAVKIMTGGVIPEGVDCVIPQNQALLQQGDTEPLLIKPKAFTKGQNIKGVGSDIEKGECLFTEGHLMRSQDIALIASVGISEVTVYAKLKVLILLSSDQQVDQLKRVNEPLKTDQVYDVKAWLESDVFKQMPALLACERFGDEIGKMEPSLLKWSKSADVYITISDASEAHREHVKKELLSLKKHWNWKLKMKPIKPLSVVFLNQDCLLAVPANSLTSLVARSFFAKAFVKNQQAWLNRKLSHDALLC